jgi:hypothetical protein
MPSRSAFIQAIHDKQMIEIEFFSKEDGGVLRRRCAPMDFGPSRRAHEKNDRFHIWDFDSDTKKHTLSLNPEQVKAINVLPEAFDPASFVTWNTQTSRWFVKRNWGNYS